MSDDEMPDRPDATRRRLRVRAKRLVGADQVYALLADDPEAIEPGLRVVERSLALTPSRRVELLLAAKSGRPIAVIASAEPRDDLALEAIDLVRALRRAGPLLARVFPDLRFDLPPRLLVVAPRLSRRAVLRLTALPSVEVEVHEFRCVEVGGVRALLVERVRRERRRRGERSPQVAPAAHERSVPPPQEKLVPVLQDLRSRARERILRLSDAVVSEPIADDGERFRLGDHVIAEVRVAGTNALEVGAGGGGAGTQPVFNNTELEDALSPVIRRFFALYRQQGPPAATRTLVPEEEKTAPIPPDLRPASLTREEIDEFYKDSEN